MSASMERKIIRWFHIIASIPEAMTMIILSGFWLWLGHYVKRWFRKKTVMSIGR